MDAAFMTGVSTPRLPDPPPRLGGRRHRDNEELDDAPPSAHVKRTAQESFTPEAFRESVRTAQEYIRAGDIFQVVLSQRFAVPARGVDLFDVYRMLRALNPSPYMFFLEFGDLQVVGSSPEALVKLNGDVASLRPIAGTLPRGETRDEDLANEKALLADPKEAAEHVMGVSAEDDVDLGERLGQLAVRSRAFVRQQHDDVGAFVEHRHEAGARYVALRLAVDAVAHLHVVRRHRLRDRPGGGPDLEEPAGHLLPGADFGDGSVDGRQTQPRPLRLARSMPLDTVELFKEMHLVLIGNTWPIIINRYHHIV